MAGTRGSEAWYIAPTYRQAKEITWRPLKRLLAPFILGKPNESELSIELRWGARIALKGAENYDSLRGPGLNGVVFDEYADIDPKAWTEVVRAMLSDRLGTALFIGTPKGYNHFHDLYSQARSKANWASWQFTTLQGGNVPPQELQDARRDLDEKTFRQEYEASFQNLYAGRVYYRFDRTEHVRPRKFQRSLPLCWTLDFNVDPMCSILAQIDSEGVVHVLDEIVLPDSNTWEAAQAFLERIGSWLPDSRRLQVRVYGDASGANRRSSASRTDWQIVKDFFASNADRLELVYRVGSANPEVKDRVNCMNARIRNQAGEDRLFVDPRCTALIADLEKVAWKVDTHGTISGSIDKTNPKLTHTSDALGYLVAREFPMRSQVGEVGR